MAFATAERDRLAGKLQLAVQEFNDLATAYPTSPYAPMALYEQGMMYVQNEQPEDAIKAFDRLLEQFGDTPMRMPAQFAKAEQLAALAASASSPDTARKYSADAAREFTNFAKIYPEDEKAPIAKQRAAELSSPSAAKPKPSTPKSRRGK
jgi:outer membrane protein assembly factor BamD (BamD/ComL family)